MTFKAKHANVPDLEPNKCGYYSLCFHSSCRQPPLCDEMEIRDLFSPVAPIAHLTKFKGLQFVYFTNKELAIKAWSAFHVKLKLCRVDSNRDCMSVKNFKPEKSNSTESKETKTTNKKYSDDSTENDSPKGVVLFMENLAMNSTQQQIQEFMLEIRILESKILKKNKKCYAFLKVSTTAEADRAVKMFHNKLFKDQRITLKLLQSLSQELESPTGDAKALTMKGFNINKDHNNNNNENVRGNRSSINCNQNYDYLKARMPPLENIVSDDDDDGGDSDVDATYFGKTSNEDTKPSDVTNSFHLFVGNFPYRTSEADLMKLFRPYRSTKVRILNTNDRSRSTQGFVCFSNAKDLDEAAEEIDRSEYKKHILLVTLAICGRNPPKSKHLPSSIIPVSGESQYERKGMPDSRNEKCSVWLKNSFQFDHEPVVSHHKKQTNKKGSKIFQSC